MNETSAASNTSPEDAPVLPGDNSDQVGIDKLKRPPLSKLLGQFIIRRPKMLVVAWMIVALLFIGIVPTTYLCWWLGISHLSAWPGENLLLWILAGPGIFLLSFAPLWYLMGVIYLLRIVADISVSIEEEPIRAAQTSVMESEAEMIKRFESTDDVGLLPLLTYSRVQLDAYYNIGLNQTRKSFLHGIVAMWFGFALLLAGLALYIVPLSKFGLNPPAENFEILVLGGAAIIEFISALFLWMYRSTTAQLTYLYDRQMYSHTAILCFRMASTIEKEKGDEARASIVAKLLDWNAKPARPASPSGSGLASLLQGRVPKKESD
ncbi:MAG: hypothetical protein OER87_08795 [Gammaproteobacteria bacterium]|nr:hypothetical protein [Gammaproteobacteria bacterium]